MGRLTARAWDLEMSADVGQQLTVPPEMVSSLRPEQALQSYTQQSVYFVDFKAICNVSWFVFFWFVLVLSLRGVRRLRRQITRSLRIICER